MATRLRGAHRGIVTRRILELDDMFLRDENGTEALHLAKVRQMKLVLQEKMDTRKLDNAILDDLRAMERDIEETDEFKLKIQKTIDKIDAVLAPPSRGPPISLGHAPS